MIEQDIDVSIPFRADTGFEPTGNAATPLLVDNVSIPFRADTGFEPRNVSFGDDAERRFNPFQG